MNYKNKILKLVDSVITQYQNRNENLNKMITQVVSDIEKENSQQKDENDKIYSYNRLQKVIEMMSKNDETIIKLIETLSRNIEKLASGEDEVDESDKSFDNLLSE